MLDQPLVFLDVETTGSFAGRDRITEIGMLEVEDGALVGEWSTLVNPGISIPPSIQQLTGITNDMVARAPAFEEISGELKARLDGRLLVAHNARFDYGVLRREFERAGLRYRANVLCTVKLSRRLFPQHSHHNLDALIARHGIECSARHRALPDARVLWELVQRWEHDLDPAAVRDAAAELVRTPKVPEQLPEDVFEDIPDSPGVYVFYGAESVLYVGKNVNLRAGVLSHFSGESRGPKDRQIARDVLRIEWKETAGELGALIEASRLKKALAPLYNRRPHAPEAFVPQPWPFRGRIGVREISAQSDESELIVLDRWCYLGTARSEYELSDITGRAPAFDFETYAVLARFLRKPRRSAAIVDLEVLSTEA